MLQTCHLDANVEAEKVVSVFQNCNNYRENHLQNIEKALRKNEKDMYSMQIHTYVCSCPTLPFMTRSKAPDRYPNM